MKKKASNTLVGSAGEYYVCAEICRRGNLALITMKNNPLYDVIAANPDGSRAVAIQVKTRSIENKQGWKLGKDITMKKNNPELFVILVNLKENGLPEFYIYEYDVLAERVERNYREYLSIPRKDGTKRKDVAFRWHDENFFTEDDKKRKNNWELIEKALKST